jgi:hypothetical protein
MSVDFSEMSERTPVQETVVLLYDTLYQKFHKTLSAYEIQTIVAFIFPFIDTQNGTIKGNLDAIAIACDHNFIRGEGITEGISARDFSFIFQQINEAASRETLLNSVEIDPKIEKNLYGYVNDVPEKEIRLMFLKPDGNHIVPENNQLYQSLPSQQEMEASIIAFHEKRIAQKEHQEARRRITHFIRTAVLLASLVGVLGSSFSGDSSDQKAQALSVKSR